MKCVILFFVLLFCLDAFAQENTPSTSVVKSSTEVTDSRWDLNKNVWSHAQAQKKAQKPVIDTDAIENWPRLGDAKISNDGKYVAYTINNQPKGSNTLVVKSTDGNWEKEFVGAKPGFFSEDSKKFIFIKGKDSLCFLNLGTEHPLPEYIPNVSSFKVPQNGKGEWIAYQLKDDTNELVLRNLITGKEKRFENVDDYLFDENGKVLLFKSATKTENIPSESLHWVDLSNATCKTIWEGKNAVNFVFDDKGKQLAFLVKDNDENVSSKRFGIILKVVCIKII